MGASSSEGRTGALGGLALWLLCVYVRDMSTVMSSQAKHAKPPVAGQAAAPTTMSSAGEADEEDEFGGGAATAGDAHGRVVISFCGSWCVKKCNTASFAVHLPDPDSACF